MSVQNNVLEDFNQQQLPQPNISLPLNDAGTGTNETEFTDPINWQIKTEVDFEKGPSLPKVFPCQPFYPQYQPYAQPELTRISNISSENNSGNFFNQNGFLYTAPMFNFFNQSPAFGNPNQNSIYLMNSTMHQNNLNNSDANVEAINQNGNTYSENQYGMNEFNIGNLQNTGLETVRLDNELSNESIPNSLGGDEFNQNSTMTNEEIQTISAKYTHQRFPIKLWNLASDENFKPIQWSQDGLSLLIDEAALEPLLGYLFRSKKFSSFLRQLHLYSFRKVARARSLRSNIPFLQPGENRIDDRVSEYQCTYFQRDRQDDLKNVRRIYRCNQIEKSKSSQTDDSLTSHYNSDINLTEDQPKMEQPTVFYQPPDLPCSTTLPQTNFNFNYRY